jgi:ubiquitin-protein ligase
MIRDLSSHGKKRLQEEIYQLTGSPDVVFHGKEDVVKMMLLNMTNTCPTTFEISVGSDYPRHPPAVRCLDYGFQNKYISRDNALNHPNLKHRWITAYGISNILQTVRDVAFMFDESATDPDDTPWFDAKEKPYAYPPQPTKRIELELAHANHQELSSYTTRQSSDHHHHHSTTPDSQEYTSYLDNKEIFPTRRAPAPAAYHYPAHLRSTFIRDTVGSDESKFFKAAGVLLYRVDSKRQLEVLLGKEVHARYMWTLLVRSRSFVMFCWCRHHE